MKSIYCQDEIQTVPRFRAHPELHGEFFNRGTQRKMQDTARSVCDCVRAYIFIDNCVGLPCENDTAQNFRDLGEGLYVANWGWNCWRQDAKRGEVGDGCRGLFGSNQAVHSKGLWWGSHCLCWAQDWVLWLDARMTSWWATRSRICSTLRALANFCIPMLLMKVRISRMPVFSSYCL